jgi:hypothetical protein
MMAAAKPSRAAPDIQIPGMAGFLVSWITRYATASLAPSVRDVCFRDVSSRIGNVN